MNTWPLLFFFLLAYGFQLAALFVADRFIAAQDSHTQSMSSCNKAAKTRISMSIETLCNWDECLKPTQLQLERRRVYGSLSFNGYYLIMIPLFSILAVSRMPEETTLVFLLFRAAFYGFLMLFIVCDSERQWLPRCFTLAFFITGMASQFCCQPDRVWFTVLAPVALWTGLVIFRTCVNRRHHADVFGMGDVWLIAGLATWFSIFAVLTIISSAAALAILLLLVKKYRFPSCWRHYPEYRGVPFAPFYALLPLSRRYFLAPLFPEQD